MTSFYVQVQNALVRDSRGSQIAGADVCFFLDTGQKLLSDERGQFELPAYWEAIWAGKPGYEGAMAEWSPVPQLTLHDIIRIPAGQSVRVTVGPGDSAGAGRSGYRLRTIRVFSNGDRRVGLQLTADDNGPVDYRLPQVCGDLCLPNSPSTFFLEGGGERQVNILIPPGSASRTVTLTTTAVDP